MEKIMMTGSGRKTKWLKKLGFWGFLFFLVKGIIWLVIAAAGYRMAT